MTAPFVSVRKSRFRPINGFTRKCLTLEALLRQTLSSLMEVNTRLLDVTKKLLYMLLTLTILSGLLKVVIPMKDLSVKVNQSLLVSPFCLDIARLVTTLAVIWFPLRMTSIRNMRLIPILTALPSRPKILSLRRKVTSHLMYLPDSNKTRMCGLLKPLPMLHSQHQLRNSKNSIQESWSEILSLS